MKAYADYAFYVEEYGGKSIKESDFTAASLNATQYIKYITLGRSEKYSGDEIKYAMCAVTDVYCEVYDLSKNSSSKGKVKSENTDGYSISYTVQSADGESTEELFKRKAYAQVKHWLSDTGLLNRRVGCNHDHKCGLYNL